MKFQDPTAVKKATRLSAIGMSHKWNGVWKNCLNRCPHCQSPVNPLRLVFMDQYYHCHNCHGCSKMSGRGRVVLGLSYLAVAVLFSYLSAPQWSTWELMGRVFFVLTLAEIIITGVMLRLQPA